MYDIIYVCVDVIGPLYLTACDVLIHQQNGNQEFKNICTLHVSLNYRETFMTPTLTTCDVMLSSMNLYFVYCACQKGGIQFIYFLNYLQAE